MPTLDRSSDAAALAGVSELLWPGSSNGVERARARADDHVVLPSAARPRLVVPAGHAPTVRLVLGHGGAGHHPLKVRLRELGAKAVAASRLARVVPLPRIAGSGRTWLLDDVTALVPEARGLGLRLGTVRPNRKPVALVGDDLGRLVAVGKIGWSPLTRELVGTIDRRIRGAHETPELLLPRRLGLTEHGEHVVHWQTPLPLGRSQTPDLDVLAAGLLAISALGPQGRTPLADSTYARDVVDRSSDVEHADATSIVTRVIDRHGAVVLDTGAWHGDFTPWNVAEVGGRLAVWDWERTRDDVPVGLDAAHYHLSLAGLASDGAGELRRATDVTRPLLARLGVADAAVPAIRDLHLVEMVLRLHDHAPAAPLVSGMLQLLAKAGS